MTHDSGREADEALSPLEIGSVVDPVRRGRARVIEWLTRIRLHLASSHPAAPLWLALASRPTRS